MGSRSNGQGHVRRSVAERRKLFGGRIKRVLEFLGQGAPQACTIAKGLVQLQGGQPWFIAELEASSNTGIRLFLLVIMGEGRAGVCHRKR